MKGTQQAVSFCKNQKITHEFVSSKNYEEFLQQLAQCEHLIFFPQVLETYSRLIAEAKMVNCKIITTPKMVGFFSEDYSNQSGTQLIDTIENKMNKAFKLFTDEISR